MSPTAAKSSALHEWLPAMAIAIWKITKMLIY